jgi:hypothetical protein
MTVAAEQIFAVEEIRIPDSRLALEITRSVRDTEPALLFHHSSRVYYWAALAGRRRGLKIRSRASLCRGDVPRHGSDTRAQQRP